MHIVCRTECAPGAYNACGTWSFAVMNGRVTNIKLLANHDCCTQASSGAQQRQAHQVASRTRHNKACIRRKPPQEAHSCTASVDACVRNGQQHAARSSEARSPAAAQASTRQTRLPSTSGHHTGQLDLKDGSRPSGARLRRGWASVGHACV